MKAGGDFEGDEAELLGRLDAGLGNTWDAFLGGVGRELARWPAYRLMEAPELRASANGLAMLFRAAVAGHRLGKDERARLAGVFSERLLLGLAPEQLRAAVHAAAAAGYLHLWSVAVDEGLHQPPTLPAIHRAVLRLWAMVGDLYDVIATAATVPGTLDVPQLRAVPAAAPAATEMATLQREAFGGIALQHDTVWGLIGVVPGRYRGVDLVEAGDVVAIATGGRCGSLRTEPVSHVMVLVPVPAADPRLRKTWDGLVAAASQALWWQGAAVLAAPTPVCATDVTATDGWLRGCLRYAGVFPGATGVAGARVEAYRDAESVSPTDRLRGVRRTLGPVLSDRNGARLLRTLDALAAFDEPKAASAFLETSERCLDRHLAEVRQVTGLDWTDPWGRGVLHKAVVFRWLAAAFDGPYDPAWGPCPPLRELAKGLSA